MHKFLVKRWHGHHMLLSMIVLILLNIGLLLYDWIASIAGFILTGIVFYYSIRAERAFRRDLHDYLMTLTHRVKHAGSSVIQEMPIGIILYGEDGLIDWHNPFVGKLLDRESAVGEEVRELFPELSEKREQQENKIIWHLNDRIYEVLHKSEERLLYIQDVTEYELLKEKYNEEQIAIGIVTLDNLDEVTQGMEDQARAVLLAQVTSRYQ